MSEAIQDKKLSQIDREALLKQFGDEASWRDTLRNALTITRRELRDSFRDWRILVPIILLTLVFPFLANIGTQSFFRVIDETGGEGANAADITRVFLPLMPMIVGFFPISISLVIALESFVGEKERRSLEPLLSTPLTNLELYIGKVLAAVIPPLSASYLGVTIYVTAMVFGPRQWRPDIEVLIQILVLTTIQAIVMVTGAVVISSQTTSTRAANLLASAVILPVSLLTIMESGIIIQPHRRPLLWLVALALIVVIIILIRMGVKLFNREQLLGQSIDELNPKWMLKVVWSQIIGVDIDAMQTFKAEHPRLNIRQYYKRAVFPTLITLRVPIKIIFGAMLISFFIGWGFAMANDIEIEPQYSTADDFAEVRSEHIEGNEFSLISRTIVLQNVRVLVFSGIFGILSFGVIPILISMLPLATVGFLFGSVLNAGYDPIPILLAISAHGFIEIPALVVGWAAILQVGAIITSPPAHQTVGEAWLRAIGDAIKLGFTLVLPLLIISAVVEVFVTPEIIQLYLATF